MFAQARRVYFCRLICKEKIDHATGIMGMWILSFVPDCVVRGPRGSTHVNRVMAGLEVDFGEDRIVDLVERRREHLKDGGAGLSVLAAHDPEDRVALRIGRAIVDREGRFTMTKVDGLWPRKDSGELHTVKAGVAMVALINRDPYDSAAVAVCWQRVELTGTAVCTATMREVGSVDHPLYVGHAAPPVG